MIPYFSLPGKRRILESGSTFPIWKKKKKSRKEKISEFHNRDAIVLDEEVARFFSSSIPFSKRSFSNIRYREQYRAYIAHFYFTQWLGWQTISFFQRCFCDDRFALHCIFASYDFCLVLKRKKNRSLFQKKLFFIRKKFHWTKILWYLIFNLYFLILLLGISDLIKIIKYCIICATYRRICLDKFS